MSTPRNPAAVIASQLRTATNHREPSSQRRTPPVSDPITLQRQLHAMTDRARELEAILARLEARIVPLTVTDAAHVDRRLARAEAALDLLGVTLPALGSADRALRDLEHAKLIGDTL